MFKIIGGKYLFGKDILFIYTKKNIVLSTGK